MGIAVAIEHYQVRPPTYRIKMDFFRVIWKFRLIPLLLIVGGWFWYEWEESEKRSAEVERQIAAEAEEKKKKEQVLLNKYNAGKNAARCNIQYLVKLETFGANVTIELRVGQVGDSFPLVIKRAQDGEITYAGLCPGKYFIAIGDDKTVSTTPVLEIATNNRYTSTVRITKDVGNMGSARREKL